MSQHDEIQTEDRRCGGHLTTRRGFVGTVGFGVVSLYGLWAGYGAAPTSLSFMSEGMAGGGHGGGHGGHGAGGGMSAEAFRRATAEFIEANGLPDGSVKPGLSRSTAMAVGHAAETAGHDDQHGHTEETAHGEEAGHAGNEAADLAHHGEEADAHGEPRTMAMGHEDAEQHGGDEPLDVYMIATRYGYEPGLLRLDSGVPYRFRFMAVDADHGASINLRVGGHMIRCRARVLMEKTLVFTAPGEYLLYCTVYCGEGHDSMMGKIVVT